MGTPEKWHEVAEELAVLAGNPIEYVLADARRVSEDWRWPAGWERGEMTIIGPLVLRSHLNPDAEPYRMYQVRITGKRVGA